MTTEPMGRGHCKHCESRMHYTGSEWVVDDEAAPCLPGLDHYVVVEFLDPFRFFDKWHRDNKGDDA